MSSSSRTGDFSVSWPRRQWLKAVALIQDHPTIVLTSLVIGVSFVVFYATQLDGVAHFKESWSRWKVENFGGRHPVSRASRTSDVILSFQPAHYDRVDVLSMISLHFGGTAFRKDIERLVERGGKLRVVTLDPRLGDPDHPEHALFEGLAKAFGQEPWAFRVRAWYSMAVMIELKQAFGDAMQIGMISERLAQAKAPYISPGRSSHSYDSQNPGHRQDVIVERPETPDGFDSFSHPASVIRERPDDPLVQRFTEAFAEAWDESDMLEGELLDALLERIKDGAVH